MEENLDELSDLQKRIQNRKATEAQIALRQSERNAKKSRGAERALFIFSLRNPLRRICIAIATSRYLDWFIIIAIISNSVILGLSDFSVVDKYLNPASHGVRFVNGTLVQAFSLRNYISSVSEIPFTTIFTTECVLKIMAFGFAFGPGTYLQDSWNILDFIVVVSSLIAVSPSVPNVSAIRTIRVLRPLRSLSVIPGMRKLTSALLTSLPSLASVLILQLFVFAIFGVLGIQLFGGNMNKRCRLTGFPVKLPVHNTTSEPLWPVSDEYLALVLANPEAYRCLQVPNLDDGDPFANNFIMETSPWHHPQDCFWPIDGDDLTLCGINGLPGHHKCHAPSLCGSDYDTFGNERFRNVRVMDAALFIAELDWGYINFDHIGRAFFTIFQSITLEGWTAIMYMQMDSNDPTISAGFCVIMIVFASFFVMKLTLAVISDKFDLDEEPEKQYETMLIEAQPTPAQVAEQGSLLHRIVSNPWFGSVIMLVILANTCVLSLDHYPMPTGLDSNLEIINFALSCVFLVELLLKVAGLGLREYARDRFNLFDALIVTLSIFETIITPPSFMSSRTDTKKGAVSSLRSFRLFRVFKLIRNWKSLRELLSLLGRAVASIANFAVLLFLFIYIYALVGLQFFGNTMRYDENGYRITDNVEFWTGDLPRNNFDTLIWSLLTVFQVITGENWNSIMYDTMRGNGFAASIYFISLVIIGNFVLMNLFLALLLDNFSTTGSGESEEEEEVKAAKQDKMKNMSKRMSVGKVMPAASRRKLIMSGVTNGLQGEVIAEIDEEDEEVNQIDLDHITRDLGRELSPKNLSNAGNSKRKNSAQESRTQSKLTTDTDDDKPSEEMTIPPGRSLLLFSDTNALRLRIFKLISHPLFDNFILAFILLSSLSLAIDNPLNDPNSSFSRFLAQMDDIFAYIFIAEMGLKVFARGLVLGKRSYLRSGWNILDCLIVLSSILMMAAQSSSNASSFKSLRSLRGFRAFRPLRMISRRPGLKLVVNALFESIPEVLNVLVLCMLMFLIFSIIAVNYLKGALNHCTGDVFDALTADQQTFLQKPHPWSAMSSMERAWFDNSTCTGLNDITKLTSKLICKCWGAEWSNVVPLNFDNVANAMLAFFSISTTEGWADTMMAAIDSNGIDMQPIRDNNFLWSGFFVLFILVGSFFIMNLFVGVVIDNFNQMKESIGMGFMLTEQQRKWQAAQATAFRVAPVRKLVRPHQRWRAHIFDIILHIRFEVFIIACITLNTVLMAVQFFGQPTIMINTINDINEIFAAVFTVEAVLKIISFGWAYFLDSWNRFDFFVVIGTLVSIVVESLTGASVRSLAMIVRVFRVTRIMRLVRSSKSVSQALQTLYFALPGLTNISSILFLMLFIYATMGVQLFAKAELGDNVTDHANFQNFGNGFLLLLRAATGEAWDYIMVDLAASPSGCVVDPSYNSSMCGFNNLDGCIPLNGCGSPVSYVFFCSFTLLVTYIMLNLTIAVILEGFSASNSEEEPLFEPELLEEFQKKWSDIDPLATGYINVRMLRSLITILQAPLGRRHAMYDKHEFHVYIADLALPLYEGETIYFKDVLLAMTREMVRANVNTDPTMMDLDFQAVDASSRPILEFDVDEFFGARPFQHCVKRWVATKRELEKRFMEEYKNKIKKPSGRPKKSRDARVYTTG